MKGIIHTVTVKVITPYKDKARGVENAINAVLDEGSGVQWEGWIVESAIVTDSIITEIDE